MVIGIGRFWGGDVRGNSDGIVGREMEQWMLYEYCGTSSTNPESFSVLFMILPLEIRPPFRIPSTQLFCH